jgi:hypothetical protein
MSMAAYEVIRNYELFPSYRRVIFYTFQGGKDKGVREYEEAGRRGCN